MARTDSLSNFLTDIADSIRSKKGTTDLIPAENFDSEIDELVKINGVIKEYYVYAGEKISAGDFVEFINGVSNSVDYGTSIDTNLSNENNTGKYISAVLLNKNKMFVAYGSSSAVRLYGMVCTVDGSTIIPGVATQLSTISATGNKISIAVLNENKVFIVHNRGSLASDSNYAYGIVCTIDGTTITAGTDTQLSTSSNSGQTVSVKALNENKVFVVHTYTSNAAIYGTICEVSETNSITHGTTQKIYSSSTSSITSVSLVKQTENKVIVFHSGTDENLAASLCTIEGTKITTTTKVLTSVTDTSYAICAEALNDNEIFIAYSYGSTKYLYGMVCTIDENEINKKIDTQLSTVEYSGQQISVVVLNKNKVFIAHSYGHPSTSDGYLYGMVCNITNEAIIPSTDTQLSNEGYSSYDVSSVLVIGNRVCVVHTGNADNYILFAQIWLIDDNDIPTNKILEKEFEIQVRKSTTSQFVGVAKTGGTGGDETGHKDIIEIFTTEVI